MAKKEFKNPYIYSNEDNKFIQINDYKITINNHITNNYKYFDNNEFEIFLYKNAGLEVEDYFDEAFLSITKKDNSSVWHIIIPLSETETDWILDIVSSCNETDDIVFITENSTEMHFFIEVHKDCNSSYFLRKKLTVEYPDLNKERRLISEVDDMIIIFYPNKVKFDVCKSKNFTILDTNYHLTNQNK